MNTPKLIPYILTAAGIIFADGCATGNQREYRSSYHSSNKAIHGTRYAKPAVCSTINLERIDGLKVCFAAQPFIEELVSLYAGECAIQCTGGLRQGERVHSTRAQKVVTAVKVAKQCRRSLSPFDPSGAGFDYASLLTARKREVVRQADGDGDGLVTSKEAFALKRAVDKKLEELCLLRLPL